MSSAGVAPFAPFPNGGSGSAAIAVSVVFNSSQQLSAVRIKSEIDTYALYKVFKQYDNSVYELGLDYGGIETEQTWTCRRGEEVRIADHL